MKQKILANLLHYANAQPPFCYRDDFYAVKEKLLHRFGRFAGHDLQEIRKECWGPFDPNGDWGERIGCQGARCCHCGGTGIFDIRWVRLERWEWCGYVFHRPAGDTRVPPDLGTVRIFGRINHPDYGDKSREACLWLYVLTGDWRKLWRALTSSSRCGRYWWPLMNVQRVVMKWRAYLSWRRCWCGHWFFTAGTGWQVCRKCRQPTPVDEVPF